MYYELETNTEWDLQITLLKTTPKTYSSSLWSRNSTNGNVSYTCTLKEKHVVGGSKGKAPIFSYVWILVINKSIHFFLPNYPKHILKRKGVLNCAWL